MAITVTIKIEGDQQVLRTFLRFAEDVQHLEEPFNAIANDFYDIENRQFDSEGGYGSGGWAALSDVSEGKGYASWKAKHFPGTSILVRWGNLRESLTMMGGYNIRDVEPLSVTLGTMMPYAKWHQRGTGRMPQRRVIDLTEDDKSRWVKIIQAYLVSCTKRTY